MKAFRILLAIVTIICASVLGKAQVWQSLDGGIPAAPTAMTSYANLLAVSYSLGIEKEQRVHEVSIWNGVYWSKLPRIYSDSNSIIKSLLFKDSGLYIAGKFTAFNSLNNVRNIVHWKNGSFQVLPPLATNEADKEYVQHLNHFGNMLVVAGSFRNTEVSTGNNLAFFEDGKWVSPQLDDVVSINGPVTSTLVVGGRLVVGGYFTKIGSLQTSYLAGFNAKSALSREKNEYVPIKMMAYDTSVFFWGEHATNSSVEPGFFLFNADTLYKVDDGIEHVNNISDLFTDGKSIYAIGEFELTDVADKQNLIRFDNDKWVPVPGGHFQGIKLGEGWRGHLITSGSFKTYQSIELINIARYLPNMGAVQGKVYFDRDENCVFSTADRALNDRLIYIEPGGFVARPDEKGMYLTYLEEGKYTFTLLPRKYWSASPCDALKKTVVVEDGIVTDTTDFALIQTTSVRDLAVKLFAQSGPIAPRKNVQLYYIHYENLGSTEVDDGKVTLHFDQKLQDLSASPMPDEVQGDSATWYFTLRPGISNTIKCAFVLEQDASEKLNLMASVGGQNQTVEEDNDNNESYLTQTITEEEIEIGKYINPGQSAGDTAFIEPGTKSVDYQISFSNFSSDTVRTVYVVDTIGLNHSIQEIRETGASHPYTYQIIPGQPGQNVATVIWTFPKIDLAPNPTKNGEVVADDGFIGFSIGLKPGLKEGVLLSNTAHVAFDYSDEKSTNSVYALVDELGSAEDVLLGQMAIYPNPTDGAITISGVDVLGWEYDVIGVNGQLYLKGSVPLNQQIDIQDLKSGLYVLRLHTLDGSIHQRIIRR